MRNQRQFDAPMSAMEAAQRAQYILGKWNYRSWGIPGGVRFERGFTGSALFVFRPHQVHAIIDLHLQEVDQSRCRVTVEQKVMKLGQPCPNLDKMVWAGDLDDLEAMLTRREEPSIDRVGQDRYAGAVSLKYIFAIVLPLLVSFGIFYVLGNLVTALVSIVLLVGSAVIMPYLPFKMPHFPLENQMPPPPFESNYVRGGNQP